MQIRVIPVVTETTFTTHNQDRAPSSAARYQPFGLNGSRLMTQSSSLVWNKSHLSSKAKCAVLWHYQTCKISGDTFEVVLHRIMAILLDWPRKASYLRLSDLLGERLGHIEKSCT